MCALIKLQNHFKLPTTVRQMYRFKCKNNNNVLGQRIASILVVMLLVNISACYGKTAADSWLLFAREVNKSFKLCSRNVNATFSSYSVNDF